MLIQLMLCLAQSPLPETTAGWAGWASALSSGGVLGWFLLKYLPDVHRRDEKKDELHRAHVQALTAEHATTLKTLTSAFVENIKDARAELKELMDLFRKEQRETRHESRDALNTVLLRHDEQIKGLATAVKTDFEALADRLIHENTTKEQQR